MAGNDISLRELRIIVTGNASAGLREISRNLSSLNGTVKSMFGSITSLTGAFAGYFAALKIGQLATMADEMQNLFNRIKVLNGSTTETTFVFEELLQRASRTKTSIADLANIYATLAATLRTTGISSKLLLDVTETLQNTFRLSGTTGELAAQGTLQLAQGLALGTLRGQDLRSVLQSNVFYGDLLAKQLGITRDKLYKFAETGQITAKAALGALLNNMDAINNQAKGLSATFGSVLSASFNNFRVQLFNFVQDNALVSKFEFLIDLTGNKFVLALDALSVAMAAIAISQAPALAGALAKLGTALAALATTNPFTAAILAIGAVIVVVNKNMDELIARLTGLRIAFDQAVLSTDKFFQAIGIGYGNQKIADKSFKEQEENIERLKGLQDALYKNSEGDEAKSPVKSSAAEIKKYLDSLKPAPGKLSTVKGELAKLNAEFKSGKIDAAEYTNRLNDFNIEKLDIQFRDGRINLEQYKQGLIDAKRVFITRDFDEGGQSAEKFAQNIRKIDIEELNFKLRSGKLTLAQYNAEMLKTKDTFDLNGAQILAVGAQSYISSVGTFASGIAGAIENTFKHLEDSFVDFIKTGKFNFANFTQAVLDDLNRIIVRSLIISPIAKGLLGAVGSTPTNVDASNQPQDYGQLTAATGAAFENGVRKFAAGGLVSSPTLFSYAGGRTGLMGEAGTEAIMPLKRHSNGDLGVQATASPVYLNIVNNADVSVEQNSTTNASGERVIEVLIKQKVAEGFANGSYDKVLQSTYGLRRAGN